MTKFEKIYNEMIDGNIDAFVEFKKYSDLFSKGVEIEMFHSVGEKILSIISKYETILCGDSDRSGKGKFTSSLSEKFWSKIRENYEYIDDIGVF